MDIRNKAIKELKRTIEGKLKNIMETSKSILNRLDAHVIDPRRDIKSITPMVIPAILIRFYKKCHEHDP